MPNATAEPVAELVQTPDLSTLFCARRSELRLVKKPIRQTRDREGDVSETIPGQTLVFRDGILRIPPQGRIALEDGSTIPVEEAVEWLKGHKLYLNTEEGFWHVDRAAPPISPEELQTLMELATDLNLEGLAEFVRQESEGWARPDLLKTAEGAMERVQAAQERLTAPETKLSKPVKAE